MQLHQAVVVFVGFLVLGPMWFFMQLVLESVETGQWDPRIFALPAAAVGLIAMMGFAFAYESRRALRELAALLEGETSSNRA